MAVNASNVLVGAPDQLVTGAICDAPLGTKLPTHALDKINAAFEDSGYISEDGVSLSLKTSTETIRDWSAAGIRQILKEFTGTVKWTELEVSKKSLERAFGTDSVTTEAAGQDHGTRVSVAIGAQIPSPRSWVFKIKDGKKKVLLVVPNGQATISDDISFTSSDAATIGIELNCAPDERGKNIYIYTDDGVFSA
ncbi:phage tail tube protein [Atopobium deltae]|nr:hypothetical protein [Atopobium deltae]